LADAVPAVLEKIDPALTKATATLESLQKTADDLTRLTGEGSDLPVAFAEFRKFGPNLHELTGPTGSLRRSACLRASGAAAGRHPGVRRSVTSSGSSRTKDHARVFGSSG